ncbi:MAG: hypothetical protein IH891_10275 [Planctomycetes bacterium]|nr:hypothetical protein [Planctomycetota bacterium]
MFNVGGSMALIQVMERFPPDEVAVEAAIQGANPILLLGSVTQACTRGDFRGRAGSNSMHLGS